MTLLTEVSQPPVDQDSKRVSLGDNPIFRSMPLPIPDKVPAERPLRPLLPRTGEGLELRLWALSVPSATLGPTLSTGPRAPSVLKIRKKKSPGTTGPTGLISTMVKLASFPEQPAVSAAKWLRN